MLISKKNNKGFSLVEVIVSMLVLSIVISSVLTAFSVSAKSNAKTKAVQSGESLMEDLLELAGAVKDSGEYADTVKTMFSGTLNVTQPLSPTETVEICEVTGIQKGSQLYNVEIIRDTEPAGYANMNAKNVLSFGETGSTSVLVNASLNGSLVTPGDAENFYDKMAFNYFNELHIAKIDENNEGLEDDEEEEEPLAGSQIKAMIDRDVYLEVVPTGVGKMKLVGYFSYMVPDTLDLPSTANRKYESMFYESDEYYKASDATPGVEKIDRVYILYSPAASGWETSATSDNSDIRIYDPYQMLGADVFIAYQEDATKTIDDALVGTELKDRFGASLNVKVSFARKGGAEVAPYRVTMYCPVDISWSGAIVNVSVSPNSKEMVPQSEEIRVQELTITIKDSEGNVVASDVVACLQ